LKSVRVPDQASQQELAVGTIPARRLGFWIESVDSGWSLIARWNGAASVVRHLGGLLVEKGDDSVTHDLWFVLVEVMAGIGKIEQGAVG
jgi:hypothetical protein